MNNQTRQSQKKEFLNKQLEILRQKATDMTVGNYMTIYKYYTKKLEQLDDTSLPPFDNEVPKKPKTRLKCLLK